MFKRKDNFKYHTSFASKLRCPISKESGKLLAKASVDDLKSILPEIAQQEGWDDLLPVAGNACVVNYANKNRDAINTAAAIAIAPYFADKFINVEHDRDIVIGFIKNASFSTFNANYMLGSGSEALASEDAAKLNSPFNLSLGGVVWRVVAPSVAQKIEDCNNPDSPDFLTLGMSWELGFDSYAIAVGPQTLADCRIISAESEVDAMSKYLVQNKGPGQLEDGSPVYRLITEASGAVPLGIGLTFAPAAAVTGVITPEFDSKATENKEKVSQSEIINVTTTKNTTTDIPSMKTLTTLAEVESLNDATKADYSLANIAQVVRAETKPLVEVERIVADYQQKLNDEKAAKQKVIDDAASAAAKASSDVAANNDKYENLKKQFEDLLNKQNEIEATNKFNERFQAIDNDYELDDAQRQSIAESIKGLTDDAYATWLKNFANFANKSKKTKEEAKQEQAQDEAKAALENAKKNAATASINNNPTQSAPSLVEKLRGAFSKDNVTITANSRRGR